MCLSSFICSNLMIGDSTLVSSENKLWLAGDVVEQSEMHSYSAAENTTKLNGRPK